MCRWTRYSSNLTSSWRCRRGKWKSEDDVRATPSPEEEVREETVGVTEETTPSSPMYKPVLDKLEKMSDNLPDETSRETLQVVMPRLDQNNQARDQMNQHQMRMLHRIMRNTRRGRGPRGGIRDQVFGGGRGKGGGHGGVHGGGYPKQSFDLIAPRPSPNPYNINQQTALAGLIGKLEGHAGIRRPSEPLQNPIQFPQQPTQQPMQPEVIEEQEQQMEILGQPKQFAGGGIVNALMATPVGQAAIQKYAEGGDITFDSYKYDYGPTGDSLEDILEGIKYNIGTDKERPARFFGSKDWLDDPSKPVVDWGPKEEDESPTLKSVRKILKPKRDKQWQPDDAVEDFDPNKGFVGRGPGSDMDTKSGYGGKTGGVETFSGMRGDPFGLAGLISGAMNQPGSTLANFLTGFTPLGIPNLLSNILGGPTVGDLFTSKSELDKILDEVNEAKIGKDPNLADMFAEDPSRFKAAQELLGDDGGIASTPQGAQDVISQVDTFSDHSDNVGGYDAGSDVGDDDSDMDDEGDAI